MSSKSQIPSDLEWDEAPRSRASRVARNAGLVIGLAWLVSVIGYIVVELVGSEDVLGIFLLGGFVLSAGLLITSALLDRREAYRTDPYRRVKK